MPNPVAPQIRLTPIDPSDRSGLRRFARVASIVNAGDRNWVAPLWSEFEATLGPRNPFWRHAERRLWIAERAGRDLGRIAAIHDDTYGRLHGTGTMHFGFFDVREGEQAAAEALVDAVCAWAGDRGGRRLIGPTNPSLNDECGLLIEGHERPPVVMMPYSRPHHGPLLESLGFRKCKDLLGFHVEVARCPESRLRRLGEGALRRHPGLDVRPVTRRSLAGDVPRIKQVYNGAWESNWGAVPLTDEEIDFLVERLRPLLVDGLVWVAEERDSREPAAFLLLLPDANEFIRPLRGRLLSPGLLPALPYLLGLRRPRRIRLLALGTLPRFRGRGLEAAMFARALEAAKRLGFEGCEATWILEDNVPVRRLVDAFRGVPSHRYRIYERELQATGAHPAPGARRDSGVESPPRRE